MLVCFGPFYLHLTKKPPKFKIMALQQGGLPVGTAGDIEIIDVNNFSMAHVLDYQFAINVQIIIDKNPSVLT